MPLTIEQITQEFTATPELKTAVLSSLKDDFVSHVKADGTVIRSKKEDEDFLSNYEKNIIPNKVNEQIGQKVKEVHEMYDKDLFELTGEKKNPEEKTYEFLKRKIGELKTQRSSKTDPVLEDKIKELTAKLDERKDFVPKSELEKLQQKYFTDAIGMRIGSSLEKQAVAVPAHITDEKQKQSHIETQKRLIKNDFLQRFTAKQDEQGNIVYYEGDKLQTNPATAAALSEDELISTHYAGYFVPPSSVKTGAGSGPSQGSNALEASLKTKEEVLEFLTKKFAPEGIRQGNEIFNKEYDRIVKDYGITQ